MFLAQTVFSSPAKIFKRGRFDENGGNDKFAFYPLKTRVSLLRPPKTTKMTKNGGCHLGKGMVWKKPGLFFPEEGSAALIYSDLF